MDFPLLFGNVSRGTNTKQWSISVQIHEESGSAHVIRKYGLVDGKQTESCKMIFQGKNIGKKNETSAFQQACNEATSLWKKQKEKGYVEKNTQLTERHLPMMAHDFSKRGKDINMFTAFAQPKLDGVRLMINTNLEKISRTGKSIEILDHLNNDLKKLFCQLNEDDIHLDGELFTFDLTFEEICGCFRQSKNVDSKKVHKLKYHIFDCYLPSQPKMPFSERFLMLQNAFQNFDSLILIETVTIKDQNINCIHEKYIHEGYEGLILRNSEGAYKPNFRSIDLQKCKCFQDDEFQIADVKEASGNDIGTAVFVCILKNGNESFAVRPRGSRELRKIYLSNKQAYIGKYLTVRYQNLSENGIPRFPVGIAVRDYE